MPRCFEFEVSLRYIQPRIWRRFLLSETATFADLHHAIQEAFGWERAHLWAFQTAGRGRRQDIAGVPMNDSWGPPTPDATRVKLSTHFGRKRSCLYVYDFGDGWEHHVKLKRTVESGAWRELLAGARAGPPEDCGGPPGYDDCVAVATGTRNDPDRAEWLGDWVPDGWSLITAKRRFDHAAVPRRRARPQADAVIDEMFAEPPESTEELEDLLDPLHRSSARKALAVAIETEDVARQLPELAVAGFSILGLGRQLGRLGRIARSTAHPMWRRSVCMQILVEHAPEEAASIQASMSVADKSALAQHGLRQFVLMGYSDPDAATTLLEMLVSIPDTEQRQTLLTSIAIVRRQLGFPASGLYPEVWHAPELVALRPVIRAALIGEPTATARMLLAGDEDALAQNRAGLWETIPGIDDIPAPASEAWLSTCDGKGAFNILMTVGTDQKVMGGLCIRTAAEIRDSWVLPDQTTKDVEDVMGEFQASAHLRFRKVPMGVVSTLVEGGLERGARAGIDLDGERFRAAALILHQGTPVPMAAPRAGTATLEQCRELLSRPEYFAWFFDRDDLARLGLPPPPRKQTGLRRWKKRAKRTLNCEPLRRRLEGMTEHMARWHHAAGETEPAAVCQAALEALRDGDHPPLFTAMAEMTIEQFHTAPQEELLSRLFQMMTEQPET